MENKISVNEKEFLVGAIKFSNGSIKLGDLLDRNKDMLEILNNGETNNYYPYKNSYDEEILFALSGLYKNYLNKEGKLKEEEYKDLINLYEIKKEACKLESLKETFSLITSGFAEIIKNYEEVKDDVNRALLEEYSKNQVQEYFLNYFNSEFLEKIAKWGEVFIREYESER